MDVKRTHSSAVIAGVLFASFVTTPALAAPDEPPEMSANALEYLISRPHTIMELEGGIIALPGAPISNAQRGGDTPIGRVGRGDATMQAGAHVLYRFNKNYVIGAGVIFSPFGTSDDQYGGGSHLSRTHTRSYLFLGAEGRYVPLRYKSFEGWAGVSVGGVIVADRFHTEAPVVPPILGVPDVTIRTEGFALGLQVGATYYISENWIAGANLRGYDWILPEGRQCSPIGDCATLAGSLQVFELGLTIGYRLPL
jgi:opacity protein-like surface antigen